MKTKEIDYTKIWHVIIGNKKKYIIVLPVTFVIACALILCVPQYYTCELSLAPETSSNGVGSLASLADSIGIGGKPMLLERMDAIPPDLYPDIVCSAQFIVQFFDEEVTTKGGAMTWNLPFGNEIVLADADYMPTVPKKEGETWNEMIYRLSQLFSLHGQNKDALAKTKLGAWEYDIIGPWYKCNMTDVVAAIGLVQFERYPEMLAKRRHYIEKMDAAFKELPVAVLNHYGEDHAGSGHLYMVRLLGRTREEANKVIGQMAERGIATNVHYKPLPMMTAYKALGFDINNYPNAYNMFVNEITLPLNTRMTEEDVDYVIENFVEVVKSL